MALSRGSGSRLAVQTITLASGEVIDLPVHATVDALGNPISPGTLAVTTTQSGTISASGGTQAITFTTTSRQEVLNPSAAILWASWGTPAVNGAGSFAIAPNGSYAPGQGVGGTLTLLSTAATQPYTVNRFA